VSSLNWGGGQYPSRQCCSCFFVSGRTVVYRSHYKRPQFPSKVDFGGPNYRLQRLMLRLKLTGPAGLCWRLEQPGRKPSCCVAWQLQHWGYIMRNNIIEWFWFANIILIQILKTHNRKRYTFYSAIMFLVNGTFVPGVSILGHWSHGSFVPGALIDPTEHWSHGALIPRGSILERFIQGVSSQGHSLNGALIPKGIDLTWHWSLACFLFFYSKTCKISKNKE